MNDNRKWYVLMLMLEWTLSTLFPKKKIPIIFFNEHMYLCLSTVFFYHTDFYWLKVQEVIPDNLLKTLAYLGWSFIDKNNKHIHRHTHTRTHTPKKENMPVIQLYLPSYLGLLSANKQYFAHYILIKITICWSCGL